MGELEQLTKDVMSQVVEIVEEIAQAVEVTTKEAKEEGEEPSKVDLSFLEIPEAALAEANARRT